MAKKKDLRFVVVLHDGETWETIEEGCALMLVDMNVAYPKGEDFACDAFDEAFRDATVASWNLNWLVRRELEALIGVHAFKNVEEIKGWFDDETE